MSGFARRLQQGVSHQSQGSGGSPGLLRWAPPNTAGYTTKIINTSGATGGVVVTLDDSTDYVIQQSGVLTACVTIKGGRNIVWIGGESNIATEWSLNESDIASVRFYQSDNTTARTTNNGRIIHLEGFYAHGYYASADIQTNCPEAIVQIQNCRVEGGTWGHQTAQGDSANTPHPDIIQTWGGVKELRVDYLTGLSTYQGLTIDYDLGNVGNVYLYNINLRKNTGSCDAADNSPRSYPNYLIWTGQGGSNPGNIYVGSGTVWVSDNPPSRVMTDGNVMWPTYNTASDGTGTYGYWPLTRSDCLVLDATDNSQVGRFYDGNPPGGDYVPANVPGLSYVSPGYIS